jgi:ppGpp synthetase/RelA/SpoT-type nucleotidyltranferase
MNKQETINKYIELRPLYKKLAEKIAQIIREVLEINGINYHAISYRAKEIESFSKKIDKPKYNDPINELTDFAGIRIIGYVEEDVKQIQDLIVKLFDIDYDNSLDKSEELGTDKVGYKSVHFVGNLAKDRLKLPEYKRFGNLKFEIQIRTILQHSWAEIEHDKNYKFSGELPKEIQRRFKLLAGTLELADREFNQLSKEIDNYTEEVKVSTEKGNLDIPINSTSLKQFYATKFEKLIKTKQVSPDFNGSENEFKIFNELRSFGINTLEELDSIIPKNLEKIITKHGIEENFTGITRLMLIANDIDKYFGQAYNENWTSFNPVEINYFKDFGIDCDKMEQYLK